MAPAQVVPEYKIGDKVLCFHGELLYEAKVEATELENPADKKSPLKYRVHYKGWKKTYVLNVPCVFVLSFVLLDLCILQSIICGSL